MFCRKDGTNSKAHHQCTEEKGRLLSECVLEAGREATGGVIINGHDVAALASRPGAFVPVHGRQLPPSAAGNISCKAMKEGALDIRMLCKTFHKQSLQFALPEDGEPAAQCPRETDRSGQWRGSVPSATPSLRGIPSPHVAAAISSTGAASSTELKHVLVYSAIAPVNPLKSVALHWPMLRSIESQRVCYS